MTDKDGNKSETAQTETPFKMPKVEGIKEPVTEPGMCAPAGKGDCTDNSEKGAQRLEKLKEPDITTGPSKKPAWDWRKELPTVEEEGGGSEIDRLQALWVGIEPELVEAPRVLTKVRMPRQPEFRKVPLDQNPRGADNKTSDALTRMEQASRKVVQKTFKSRGYRVLRVSESRDLFTFAKTEIAHKAILLGMARILSGIPQVKATLSDKPGLLLEITGPARFLDPITEVPGSLLEKEIVSGEQVVATVRNRQV